MNKYSVSLESFLTSQRFFPESCDSSLFVTSQLSAFKSMWHQQLLWLTCGTSIGTLPSCGREWYLSFC